MSSVDTKIKKSDMTAEEFYAQRGRGNAIWLFVIAGAALLLMVTALASRMM